MGKNDPKKKTDGKCAGHELDHSFIWEEPLSKCQMEEEPSHQGCPLSRDLPFIPEKTQDG